jgi:predicted metal-dependent phosphoesterase TrpH
LIDLHLHTSASDGALAPTDLVARAAAAGLTTISITDHDTTAGLESARAAASAHSVRLIAGIEITAVEDGRDTHVLGYFFDPADAALRRFLERQHQDRIRRIREIAERLATLGLPIDPQPLIARGLDRGQSVGRPHVAAALIARGYVQSWDEAFEKYLEKGRPAFVPRQGASAADVVRVIHAAGGVASLAHPGLSKMDERIPTLVAAGLDALEASHADHDEETERRYRSLAEAFCLSITAGSDFHGDGVRKPCALGRITMTAQELAALEARRGE